MFAPIERALGPVSRLLLCERASCLRAAPSQKGGPDTTRVALEAALQVTPLPASADEVDSLLPAYAADIPDSVIRSISVGLDLL